MLGHRLTLKIAASLLGLATIAPALQAGEKVDLSTSTSIELPKPKEVEIGNHPPVQSANPGVGTAYFAPSTPAAPASPLLEKKLRELNDQRYNWIFMKPEEMLMDSKTSSFLEGKQNGSSLLDFKGIDQKTKTAQEKFWEERDGKANNTQNSGEPLDPKNLRERARYEMMRSKAREESDPNSRRDGSSEKNTPLFGAPTQASFLQPKEKSGGSAGYDFKMPDFLSHATFNDSLVEPPKTFAFEKQEMKDEQKQRDADFMKMIQPRGASPSFSGPLDPVNTQIDATRIEANPITPGGANFTGGYNRSSSFMDSPGRSAFRPDIAGNSISDLMPKSLAPSGFEPAQSPVSSYQAPAQSVRPFVFELPRRAF
jgi:hypothetical protein